MTTDNTKEGNETVDVVTIGNKTIVSVASIERNTEDIKRAVEKRCDSIECRINNMDHSVRCIRNDSIKFNDLSGALIIAVVIMSLISLMFFAFQSKTNDKSLSEQMHNTTVIMMKDIDKLIDAKIDSALMKFVKYGGQLVFIVIGAGLVLICQFLFKSS